MTDDRHTLSQQGKCLQRKGNERCYHLIHLCPATGLQKTHNNSFGEHWDRNSNKSTLHLQATLFIRLPCTVKLTDEMFRPAKFDA